MPDKWTSVEPTHESPYWPFRKVVEGNSLAGAEQLAYIVLKYLMDLPDGTGYEPPSDNIYPRARIKKLLYWDGPLPLEQRLPTTEEMRALMFDPMRPANPPDKERGFRLYNQEFAQQAQAIAQTRLHVYYGTTQGYRSERGIIMVQQLIIKTTTNYALDTNTGMTGVSRAYDIVQAIVEAVSGVNFGGIGPLHITSITKIDDERVNTGFKIYCTLEWVGTSPNTYFA